MATAFAWSISSDAGLAADRKMSEAQVGVPQQIYQLSDGLRLEAVCDQQGVSALSRASCGSWLALPSPKMMHAAVANSNGMIFLFCAILNTATVSIL